MLNEFVKNLSNYPRPDIARDSFILLDGEWLFEYDLKDVGIKKKWYILPNFSKRINVPFCVEGEKSGICNSDPPNILWYAKELDIPYNFSHSKILLNFSAVDYETKVWLNGNYIGEHIGGYTPFYFEIEKYIKQKNFLVVRVKDSKSPKQVRGKQTILRKPFLVFYTGVSGIWQTVWLEKVGKIYLHNFKVISNIERKTANFSCRLAGENGQGNLSIEIFSMDGDIYKKEFIFEKTSPMQDVQCDFEFHKIYLWSYDEPNLYGIKFIIKHDDSIDEVKSYFGFRKIEIKNRKIYLNNKELYQKLLLCQGYFPGGIYTPESWDDYRRDIELVKSLGFNGIRMHQKIENKKFLFWCDYLGCLVWEEMPSAYLFSKKMRLTFEKEWEEVIDRDFNHPSIIVWVIFNESWGVGLFPIPIIVLKKAKEFVKYIYRKTKLKDPTRLVIDNSGYDHTSETDIVDIHHYLEDAEKCRKFYEDLKNPDKMKFSLVRLIKSFIPGKSAQNTFTRGEKYSGQPIIISEYGGFGFYKIAHNIAKKGLLENFREYTELIQSYDFICGYCYTQFYDTYQEKNGLLNFNRSAKLPIEEIKKINATKGVSS